ncbi:MAG: hypothetical protein AAGD25_02230 [Cyanobacteria bacterium P01_F01_bin.150]
MIQSNKEHLTYTKGPVTKIGETGGTVVYIFPGGKACVKKGKKEGEDSSQIQAKATKSVEPKNLAANKAAVKQRKQVVMHPNVNQVSRQQAAKVKTSDEGDFSQITQTNEPKIGDRLVQAGVINSTQLQVALYDQKAMKLRLGDVLIARGWIDQATLNEVLSK